jgi:hypothetical protein
MQVNATLIAAQQAAREARARLEIPQQPAPGFSEALKTEGFSPLPLKQTAPVTAPQPAQQSADNPAPYARPGSLLDITI